MNTELNTVTSFAPIADGSARVLILGSMPGIRSLQTGQYYAHPRNAFWPIMAHLYGFNSGSPYDARVDALKASGIAVWDVLRECVRPGSLDSAIEKGSRVPNDFVSFFATYPGIRLIAFNGAEAARSFNRYVLPNAAPLDVRFARLPSSSPAHAVALEKKIAAWQQALTL